MENTKDTGITEYKKVSVLNSATNVSNDIFNDSKSHKITTLDLNDEEQADMFLNSEQDIDGYLKDLVGKVIEVVGVTINEREVTSEFEDEETGDVGYRTYKKHSMIFFTADKKCYVTGSNSCYRSFSLICNTKHYMPSMDKHMFLEVIRVPSKVKGHDYLKLKIAK